MDVVAAVTTALEGHPAVRSVRLAGSRQRGEAGRLSDWDFAVEAADFQAVARDLPALVSSLQPLAQQWDRLSSHETYLLILPGAVKVDLLFDEPHELHQPWEVSPGTLGAIDHHFWDWILWLAAKDSLGKQDILAGELAKMSTHLLRPMGFEEIPDTIERAISGYSLARRKAESRFDLAVPRDLEEDVRAALRRSGYGV